MKIRWIYHAWYVPYLLVVIAFFMNLIFLYAYNPLYHFTLSQLHGQVGYNVNAYGLVGINPALTKKMDHERLAQGQLIDFSTINSNDFQQPTQPFVTNDTIGYGMVLALVWKITRSFSFVDVQWLQIFIFSLLMVLLYHSVFILFKSQIIAFWACIMHLFFFPLLAMNVQPVRDIWAYYGVVILLYGMLCFIYEQRSKTHFFFCAAAFGVCQYVRPSVFLVLITLSIVFGIYALKNRSYGYRVIIMISIAYVANGLFFWLPFVAYNKISYDRYFVGPVGLDLLEGLGEFPNKWGYKLDDVWASDYICKKYKVAPGTAEFDDKAREEFNSAFKEDPLVYIKNIFKRIPGLLVPGLPWIFYIESPYKTVQSWKEKITLIFCDRALFADFCLRHVYIRFYLLLGYVGILMLFFERRYWILSILMAGIVLGGLGKLPSHIEYRYIVPYYWVFGLCATYAIANCKRIYTFLGLR